MSFEGDGPYLAGVPDYKVADNENMVISYRGQPLCNISLHNFELGMARAQRVIAEHRARGMVIPIRKRRGRGHAASS